MQKQSIKPIQPPSIDDASAHRRMLMRKCGCGQYTSGGDCASCEKKEPILRRKRASRSAESEPPEIVNEVLNSPGHALDGETRALFEVRFGRDFSNVRVHTDLRAAESARAVDALAYTVGRDVVFGSGQFDPGTLDGKRLLAHELTHVAQSEGETPGISTPISIGPANDRFEAEADRHASAVASGGLSEPISAAGQPGRLSRATFKVGNAQIETHYTGLDKIPAAKYESEIESRFETYTGAKATTIHNELTKLSASQKEWVLYGLDLLKDNSATALDKAQAVSRLITHAPSASTKPTASVNFDFENEALSVSGWFEKGLTSGITPLTNVRKSFVQNLLNPNTSSSGSSSCPSPRPSSDQLNSSQLQTDMPKELKTYLQSVSVPTKVTTQSMPSLQTVANLIQGRARNYFAPYADKSSGSGNTVVQQWQYSAHLASAQGPSGTPSTDKRIAYLASRAGIVGDQGLFKKVHFDFRCTADKGVLDGIVKGMEPLTDIRALVDPILRQKSYTDQTSSPKGVVLNTALDATQYDECLARWASIKTMCHELMHVMVHPDFRSAEKGRTILTEGFPEVLGHQLYSDIAKDATSDPKLQAQMEAGLSKKACSIPASTIGQDLTGKATSYKQAADDADKIRVAVTNDRFRAAFFLGQLSLAGIQPKLRNSEGANDPHEREADDAAQAVAQSRPFQTLTNRAPVGLQARDLIHGSGNSLDPGVRHDMENALRHDFSEVRLHTDAEAAESANSMSARAYTVGRDIVFGAGQYSPHSKEGRALLAHELTHVVQQSGASHVSGPLTIADPGSAQEQQAHAIEQAPVPVSLNAPAAAGTTQVQRAPAPAGSPAKAPVREVIAIRLDHRESGGFGRFDTLLYRDCDMKVQFRMNFDFAGPWPNEKAKQDWQKRYISTVTDAWSRKFDLESTGKCENGCPRVKPFVEIYAPHTVPHVKVDVTYTTTGITSRSGSGVSHLDSLDLTAIKKGDITEEQRRDEAVKPMIPAVHEFGHLTGRHDQYAGNGCAAGYPMKGIMCFGNEVTKADYEPFANSLNQMTGCTYKPVEKA
jgi:hypothetical protein